jgi:hypothetical protein
MRGLVTAGCGRLYVQIRSAATTSCIDATCARSISGTHQVDLTAVAGSVPAVGKTCLAAGDAAGATSACGRVRAKGWTGGRGNVGQSSAVFWCSCRTRCWCPAGGHTQEHTQQSTPMHTAERFSMQLPRRRSALQALCQAILSRMQITHVTQ